MKCVVAFPTVEIVITAAAVKDVGKPGARYHVDVRECGADAVGTGYSARVLPSHVDGDSGSEHKTVTATTQPVGDEVVRQDVAAAVSVYCVGSASTRS